MPSKAKPAVSNTRSQPANDPLMGPASDPAIRTLLPEAPHVALVHAGRLVTALRLFTSDLEDARSPSAEIHDQAAQRAFEEHRDGRVTALIVDVATHIAVHTTPPDSFLQIPVPARSYTRAWADLLRLLDRFGRADLGLTVPLPMAVGQAGMAQLLDALEELLPRDPDRLSAKLVDAWRIRRDWIQLLGGTAAPREDWSALGRRLEDLWRDVDHIESETGQPGSEPVPEQKKGLGQEPGASSLATSLVGDLLALDMDRCDWDGAKRRLRAHALPPRLPAECETRTDLLAAMVRFGVGTSGAPPDLEGAAARIGLRLSRAWLDTCAAWHGEERRGEAVRRWRAPVASRTRSSEGREDPEPMAREGLGVRVVVACAIASDRSLRVVAHDVESGLEPCIARWSRTRRHAIADPASPEHDVVRLVRSSARFAGADLGRRGLAAPGEGPRTKGAECEGLSVAAAGGAIDRDPPRSIAVEPILGSDGEVQGLLWLECAGRILPPAAARLRLAAQFTRTVHAARTAPERSEPAGIFDERRLGAAWQRLIEGLGIKLSERRWAAFQMPAGGAVGGILRGPSERRMLSMGEAEAGISAAAEAARANGTGLHRPGLQMVAVGGGGHIEGPGDSVLWAIERAYRSGGVVRYASAADAPEADAALSVPGGLAIPIRCGDAPFAVFAIESTRKGGVRDDDARRLHAQLQSRALDIECAAINASDALNHRVGTDTGGGFGLDANDPDVGPWVAQLRRLSRSPSDVLFVGERGSGKRTSARAIHHLRELSGEAGKLETLACFGLDQPRLLPRLSVFPEDSVLLVGIEALGSSEQSTVVDWLRRPLGTRARCFATASSQGAIEHPDLASALGRLMVRTRPLCEARHWIPKITRSLVQRIALIEDRDVPHFDEAAEALLWRQSWRGNGTELEAVIYRLMLTLADPLFVTEADVEESLNAFGVEIVRRLPSRDPSARDLAAAAWWTRTASGRINKSRAAAVLGWDPATVTARLKELKIDALDCAARLLGGGAT